MEHKCFCGRVCKGNVGLALHLRAVHDMSLRQFHEEHLKDRPDCACGCGQKVGWFEARKRWNKYLDDHYNQSRQYNAGVINKTMLLEYPELRNLTVEDYKEMFAKTVNNEPWNQEDLAYLKHFYGKDDILTLSYQLERTPFSIRYAIQEMKNGNPRFQPTQEWEEMYNEHASYTLC